MTLSNDPPYHLGARRGRLLLVDDQAANLLHLHAIFGAEHDIQVAQNGAEALALCASAPPDLVLLDVHMPGLDGLEVCRRLKQAPATRTVPVIFVTGADSTADEMACWDAGAVDFVGKPVNAVTLRNRVHAHLALKFQADTLRDMAYVDGLTGVANRRYFDQRLASAWQATQRDSAPLAVIMIDIDFFKRYNDHYGHQAGDACLVAVSAALRGALMRPHDLLARYGGEEFVCLLPDTGPDGALNVGQALCRAVQAAQIPHCSSDAGDVVTASVGVAAGLATALAAPESLVRAADRALYDAKRTGRARVFMAR